MKHTTLLIIALTLTALLSACAASGGSADVVRLAPMEESAQDLSPQARLQGRWFVQAQSGGSDTAMFMLEVEGTKLTGIPFDSSQAPLTSTFTGTDGDVMTFKSDDGSMVYARFTGPDTAIAWTTSDGSVMKVLRVTPAPPELLGQYTACEIGGNKVATMTFGTDKLSIVEHTEVKEADITWVASSESNHKIVMRPDGRRRVFILNVLRVNDAILIWAEDEDDVVGAFRAGAQAQWMGCEDQTSAKDSNRNTSAP